MLIGFWNNSATFVIGDAQQKAVVAAAVTAFSTPGSRHGAPNIATMSSTSESVGVSVYVSVDDKTEDAIVRIAALLTINVSRLMLFLCGLQKHRPASSATQSARASRSSAAVAAGTVDAATSSDIDDPLFAFAARSTRTATVTVRMREWVIAKLSAANTKSRSVHAIEAGIMAVSSGEAGPYYRAFAVTMGLLVRSATDARLDRVPDWALPLVTGVHESSDVSHKLLHDVLQAKAEMEQAARGSWRCSACGGSNCTFVIVQTRSADEGGTAFTKCVKCGKISYFG